MDKVRTREELVQVCQRLKKEGKVIGFTSGVFDLFHAGHAAYLEKAKQYCDLLIVGVNSDGSTRKLKGELRPILSERDRVSLVASLSSVDFSFIFDELNNNTNVELLQPSLYIKAGDYDRSRLSSAPLVESYGGKIQFVPFVSGLSSSGIIDLILDRYGAGVALAGPAIDYPAAPAIFVDRDGTINYENKGSAPCEPTEFRVIPGALEALKKLRDNGFRIIIVTNQPGIGMGYYTRQDFFRVNRELLKAASKVGLQIDRVYFCPHAKSDNCDCRKPQPGMLQRAVSDLNIQLEKSYMIGDMSGDIGAGRQAGCRTILVETGKAGKDGLFEERADFEVADLAAAAKLILSLRE